jgi:hypothetical protein
MPAQIDLSKSSRSAFANGLERALQYMDQIKQMLNWSSRTSVGVPLAFAMHRFPAMTVTAVDGGDAHMLRHACGFVLTNAGHDTRALQAYLGQGNIQNTTHTQRWRLIGSKFLAGLKRALHVSAWASPSVRRQVSALPVSVLRKYHWPAEIAVLNQKAALRPYFWGARPANNRLQRKWGLDR